MTRIIVGKRYTLKLDEEHLSVLVRGLEPNQLLWMVINHDYELEFEGSMLEGPDNLLYSFLITKAPEDTSPRWRTSRVYLSMKQADKLFPL